jgi:hypothetical protein
MLDLAAASNVAQATSSSRARFTRRVRARTYRARAMNARRVSPHPADPDYALLSSARDVERELIAASIPPSR